MVSGILQHYPPSYRFQSAKADYGDRERTFRFRRPPTDIWRAHPYDYRPVRQQQQQQQEKQQQQRSPQVGEDGKGNALEAHGINEDVGANLVGLDAGGNDPPRPAKSLAGLGDGVVDGTGAKEELEVGVGEVVLGPRAMKNGEQVGWGEDDEQRVEGEDDEDEWVMSPEWAEHFRNSPSVQRYRRTSKRNTKNAIKGNQKSAGAGKGGTSPHVGGGKKLDKKSRVASAAAASAAGATTHGRAVEGQEDAKAADDAKKMELELAKIRARALLYAENQQDRELEDAIIPA